MRKKSERIFLVRFLGTVDDGNVRALLETLDDMRSRFQKFVLQIFINSQGGDMNHGFAIYDYLRRYPAPVVTIAEGLVASAGVIMFLAGEHRLITPHSSIMLHLPKVSIERETFTGHESEFVGERLRCLEEMFMDVACERTGLSRRALRKFMDDSKFFYAEEIIKCGLAHDMLGSAG